MVDDRAVAQLMAIAEASARAAGEQLRPAFRAGRLDVDEKEANDFVTSADRAAEEAILEVLEREVPEHRILAEESGVLTGSSDYEWIVDPLDGTTNFLEGMPLYAVSIACRHGSEMIVGVIFDPERDDLFCAARGQGARRNGESMRVSSLTDLRGAFLATGFPFKARAALDTYLSVFREVFLRARAIRRCGSAALDLAYTAAGIFDGFFEFRLSAWDVAAGALMVEEAGGRACDLDGGERFLESGNIIAGPLGVVADLLDATSAYANESLLEDLVPTSTSVG